MRRSIAGAGLQSPVAQAQSGLRRASSDQKYRGTRHLTTPCRSCWPRHGEMNVARFQFANGPRAVRGCVDGDPWRDVRTRASPNGCSHESLRPSPVNGSARTMGWPVRPRVPGMLPPSVRCRSPSMPSRGGGVAGRFRPGACGETTARPCTPRGAMLGFLFVHLGLTFVHGLFSCGRTTVHCRPLGFRCHP